MGDKGKTDLAASIAPETVEKQKSLVKKYYNYLGNM